MREMQKRTNYGGSHHGMPVRGLCASGTEHEHSGSEKAGTLFNSFGCKNEQTNVQISGQIRGEDRMSGDAY
jgi:hypothetical protein